MKRAATLLPEMSGSPTSGTLKVPAELIAVRDLAGFLQAACHEAQVGDAVAIDLELALVEAANNIVEHGYPAGSPGEIEVLLEIGSREAVLTISDRGTPAPADMFARCREVPLDALEGRGVGIVQSCVDEIAYTTEGGVNRLRLTKRL